MTSIQKKLAAKILKTSIKKIWIDPTSLKIKQAITRHDIRYFIDEGIIKKFDNKEKQPKKKKKQQKAGSRKGKKGGRQNKKANWFRVIRPQRRMLNELKKDFKPRVYRKLYKMVKGNAFRSKAHLKLHIQKEKLMKGDK